MSYPAIIASIIADVSAPAQASALPQRVGLEGRWRLTQPDRRLSMPALVPGVVQADLLAAHKIPDPFYRDNEKAVQWAGGSRWTYTRSFTLSPAFVHHRQIRLRCDGLDTLAQIVVNGKDVAYTDNMFRTWEFDVRPLLHPGVNKIEISFDPVEPYLKARAHQAAFPDKPITGWGYIRKAPFQQGWDFAPKIITCGIWRGIGLVGWDRARLTDIGIAQDHLKAGQAGLTVGVTADTAVSTLAHTTVWFHGKEVAAGDAPLAGGKGAVKLTVMRPQLWWPAGMGQQNLYDVRVALRNSRGLTVDTGVRTIGLRTIAMVPRTPAHPLSLTVNGRPFFAKGTNWVPCDALISRATAERERRFVDDAVGANMNLVRLWGGGYYEDDAFYDECDKKGLMCWSEFKYADAAYPVFDPAWLTNARIEARDNVRRLRHHPSIAVWSGNNECIGFVADKTDGSHMSRGDYDLLFHHVLADTVRDLAPGSVYTPGSPESGDEHDWSVWHGGAPFETYRGVHGFMSEFGFQSFPQPKSVAAYTAPNDRSSVLTPIMQFHQRNWGNGNQIILNSFNRYYRKPKDFESALWLSQIQQAEGVLTGVEFWRRDWPHSTGSLVWQYDDCWPGARWAMVAYFGPPKALRYRLAHAYAPVMLSGSADRKTASAELWISSDRPKALKGTLSWTLMRTDGSVLVTGRKDVSIPAGTSSVRALSLAEGVPAEKEGSGNLLLWGRLTVPREPVSSAVIAFAKPKDINLVAPDIRTAVAQTGASYRVTLSAAHPALWTWLDLPGIDARYSDNFVSLRPGEPVTITVSPAAKTSLSQMRRALRVRSLYDTYLPGTAGAAVTTPEPDGTIIASADHAEIEGNAAFLETGAPGNIGNWSDVRDYAQWTVKDVKPGTYSVSVNVSCPPGVGGSKFTIDIAGKQINGVVPDTASWTTYTDVALGTVQITKTGAIHIVLQPTYKPSTHVMNLRAITLKPVAGG